MNSMLYLLQSTNIKNHVVDRLAVVHRALPSELQMATGPTMANG